MELERLNTARLLSLCMRLAKMASIIVKDVLESGNLGTVDKSVNDPVTLADTRIQSLLLSNLQAYFPKVTPSQLTTVAEEEVVIDPER